jgi:AcrR family transcriptional regulator
VTDQSAAKDLLEDAPCRAPGRPRCAVTHQAILDCANVLLDEIGFSGMSVEGIAARAGVGKATIYRRWPNKASVVMDAFLAATAKEVAFPCTGSAREDIRRQMRSVVKVLNGPRGRTIATLIGVVQSDAELAEAFRTRFVAVRRGEAKSVLRRGIDNGEFKPDMDPDSILDCLYGPLYFRLLFGHERSSAKYADQLVDLVLHG